MGNIYADEALFRARIHPLRPVGTLKRPQLAALRDAVVESLEAGIDARGATIDDFRNADGARGSFQDRFLVHLREGEPCLRCGTPIRKIRAAGRGTYFCPKCQPRPRKRRRSRRRAAAVEPAVAVGLEQLAEAADRALADEDLREGHLAGERDQVGPAVGVLGQVHLRVVHAAGLEERLRLAAEAARLGGVESDPSVVSAIRLKI